MEQRGQTTSRVEEMLRTPRITPRLIPVQNKRRAAVNARQSIKLSSSVYYSRHRQRVKTPPSFPPLYLEDSRPLSLSIVGL